MLSFFFSFPINLFCLLLPYAILLFNLFSFYSLHLFRSLCLIYTSLLSLSLLLLLSLYFFLVRIYDTSCSVFLSVSLFSFPLFSFCSFYASFFAFVSIFFHFFCSLLSSFICYSCSYYWLTDFSRLFLFIYLFILYYYYFLCSLFCLYSFTTSAHWLGVLSLILYTVSAVWHSSTCSVVSSFWLHIGHFVSSSSLG